MWSSVWRHCNELFDWLLPAACQLCGRTLPVQGGLHLCGDCHEGFRPLPSPRCPHCLLPHLTPGGTDYPCEACLKNPLPLKRVVALGLYADQMREAVHRFKYRHALGLQRPLASLLARELEPHLEEMSPDLLVPVPLHRKRLQQRGYNQALQIARELARTLSIPLDRALLIRTRDTLPQQQLSLGERQLNLRSAFELRQIIPGKRVLLVDDVMTSGATLRSCADVLIRGGASEVSAAILARAPRFESAPLSREAIHA